MKENIRIVVTQNDITTGEKKSCNSCPIANSLKRQFKNAKIKVTPIYVKVDNTIYSVNKTTTDFIYNFDTGENTKPFITNLTLSKVNLCTL